MYNYQLSIRMLLLRPLCHILEPSRCPPVKRFAHLCLSVFRCYLAMVAS